LRKEEKKGDKVSGQVIDISPGVHHRSNRRCHRGGGRETRREFSDTVGRRRRKKRGEKGKTRRLPIPDPAGFENWRRPGRELSPSEKGEGKRMKSSPGTLIEIPGKHSKEKGEKLGYYCTGKGGRGGRMNVSLYFRLVEEKNNMERKEVQKERGELGFLPHSSP